MLILHGNAVGGGSITYANTMLVPPDSVWSDGAWARPRRLGAARCPRTIATAQRMLGVDENRSLDAADWKLREMADEQGGGEDSFYKTDVAVYFGDEDPAGTEYPDPYFGGEGPSARAASAAAAAWCGCRFDAKNTLDKNYLYFAEKRGAEMLAETRVVDVRPLGGAADGSDGYEITTERSTAGSRSARRRSTARHVVLRRIGARHDGSADAS